MRLLLNDSPRIVGSSVLDFSSNCENDAEMPTSTIRESVESGVTNSFCSRNRDSLSRSLRCPIETALWFWFHGWS